MSKRPVLGLLMGCVFLVGGCAAGPVKAGSAPQESLYKRVGGKSAVVKLIKEFLERVKKDTRISGYFAGFDLVNLRDKLIELACAVSGGPCAYTGRDMKKAHKGLMITNAAFDAILEDLNFSMKKLKLGDQEQAEVMGAFNATRKDIVEIK